MAPQAAAEPALPVLPCHVSKHPTRLTHWAPVSLPPTAPATPGVSLSFSTYSSTSFPLSPASSALSLWPPIHCGSASSGHAASPWIPTEPTGPTPCGNGPSVSSVVGVRPQQHPLSILPGAIHGPVLRGRGCWRIFCASYPLHMVQHHCGRTVTLLERCLLSQGGQQSPELSD